MPTSAHSLVPGALLCLCISARAQTCDPSWADWFPTAELNYAKALATWAPSGPDSASLFAGGHFPDASGVPALRVARFDGQRWHPLGTGIGEPNGNDLVRTVCAYDPDGDGPLPSALIAAGRFDLAGGSPAANIAAWDGAAWRPLGSGTNEDVHALAVFETGGMPLLIASGEFTVAGGIAASGIASWDGQAWRPLGEGLIPPPEYVSLAIHDADGPGPGAPVLVAGGDFSIAGGIYVPGIAAWDGVEWSSLGDPLLSGVNCVRSIDPDLDGPEPPRLMAGGWTTIFDPAVTRMTDAGWEIAGQFSGYYYQFGPWPAIDDIAVFDTDGPGPGAPELYTSGFFILPDYQWESGIAVFRDGQWEEALATSYNYDPTVLAPLDPDGPGPEPLSLLVTLPEVRRLGPDGDEHLGRWIHSAASAAQVFDPDGAGLARGTLILGGSFGGDIPENIASWDGQAWAALGGGIPSGVVHALALFDDNEPGEPPPLFAAGGFDEAGGIAAGSIARWDGQSWSALGSGLETDNDGSIVNDLAVCDPDAEGPLPVSLIAAGYFDRAGGQESTSIAAWDGQDWHALGDGLQGGWDGRGLVDQVAVFDDDGDGPNPPRLFAAGDFTGSGEQQVWFIAQFDGQQWTEVGGGTNGPITALVTFDPDGPGPEAAMLLAAGGFSKAGQTPVHGIARWDGAAWTDAGLLNGKAIGAVEHLAVIDEDGPGPLNAVLYVCGALVTPWNGDEQVARWDGNTWSPPPAEFRGGSWVTSSLDGAWFDEGAPGAGGLYYFPTTGVNDISSRPVARLGCPPDSACYGDCSGDGATDFFDFVCFINLFNAADPAADCDGSGGLDLFDFLCFVNSFNEGC
jgi:hypothetical protein